ncbi:MAG: hypothetical protein ACTHOP_01545 [Mesorhizobium sp.]
MAPGKGRLMVRALEPQASGIPRPVTSPLGGRVFSLLCVVGYGASMKFEAYKIVTLVILWSVLALSVVEQARAMFGFAPLMTRFFF